MQLSLVEPGAVHSGGRQGQYSIRISDQYRICFVWEDGDAYDVEIVDYHQKGGMP